MAQFEARKLLAFKAALFLAALIPLTLLVLDGVNGNLGANPVEEITHRTGDWVLNFLLITLAVTPLRRITGWNWLLRFRRMFGLYAFFYVLLHFTTYIWLDRFFVFDEIGKDIAKRPYITVGFTCFLLLIPLAVTSTNSMVRRLGAKRWQRLHKMIYGIAIGGVLHYLWLVKSDIVLPLIYGAILALLLILRIPAVVKKLPVIRFGKRTVSSSPTLPTQT
ncbi:MAG: protein-methionine-sulfoxide reductase heme-binding subunit MsrQ [Acidiferrobacterales bacterium]